MDIRVVRIIPKNFRVQPRDEEFGRETKIKPRIEKQGKEDPSFWPSGREKRRFSEGDREDFYDRRGKIKEFLNKMHPGFFGRATEKTGENFQKIFSVWKSVHNNVSVKMGWAVLIFLSSVSLSVYRANGSDSLAILGEENPTAASGLGVSVSAGSQKISFSSHENRIVDLEEKNHEVFQKVESLLEQTRYYPLSGQKDASQDDEISRQKDSLLEIEEQLGALLDQNEAIIDFSLALDYKSLIYKDRSGNLDIDGGKLKADEAVLGRVSIKKEDGKSAVGEGTILPLEKDDNLDGLDDDNLSDGKSVVIRTELVGEKSRIFLTPKAAAAIRNPLTVTEKQNGQYFKVELAEKVSEAVSFDWWIVEEK